MATLLWRMIVSLIALRISATYRLQTCPIYPIMGTILNASTLPFLRVDPPEGLVVNGYPINWISVNAQYGEYQMVTFGPNQGPPFEFHSLIPYRMTLRLDGGTDAGTVSSSVHNETDDPILAAVSYDFRCFGAASFSASWANIVTFNDITSYFNETIRVNYQVVVATDGVTSWTRWSYGLLEPPFSVNILMRSSTLPEDFTIDPYHLSANARDIALDSNVGCPGCWYFEMTEGYAHAVPSPCDCLHGTGGDPCMLQPCTCMSGWTGQLCDHDINECDGNHGCHEYLEDCVNVDGSFTCESRGCALCNDATGMYCEKHGFCFEVGTVLSSEACVKRCECKQNKKQTKTKWKCGKVKDQNVCNAATLLETCGLLNCLQSDHKKFCGKRIPSCVGTVSNFNVVALFKRKDHKSVMNTCT